MLFAVPFFLAGSWCSHTAIYFLDQFVPMTPFVFNCFCTLVIASQLLQKNHWINPDVDDDCTNFVVFVQRCTWKTWRLANGPWMRNTCIHITSPTFLFFSQVCERGCKQLLLWAYKLRLLQTSMFSRTSKFGKNLTGCRKTTADFPCNLRVASAGARG